MPLHPRLQLPTLEQAAPRRSHGFTVALALTVLAAGFAYAMPRAMNASAEAEPSDDVVLSPIGSTPTPTASASPSPSPTESDDDDGTEGTERAQNHGAAVSTAAHCDLPGKAHGVFVRSIAHDKDATVAEVEAACEAAQAAAATAAETDDAVTNGRGHGKPDKTQFDDDSDEGDDTDEDSEHGGPPDHAKGGKDKP